MWRYLRANSTGGSVMDEFTVLSRKIARSAGLPVSFVRTRICLDVLAERGLIQLESGTHMYDYPPDPGTGKGGFGKLRNFAAAEKPKER